MTGPGRPDPRKSGLANEAIRFDVAIIGGGVIGCSTAHFIKSMAPETQVVVIEPDPTYEFASTLRASGGCRVQFSRPENVEMSKFSIDFIRNFEFLMSVPGKEPPKVARASRVTA